MRGRAFDRAPRPRWSAGERPPPRAFRLPVGREGPNDAPKRCATAGSTLPRGCAPFWRSLDASIAVCRGDGRDKSGFPFPRISRPGAEGGDDRHPTTIHNHGEDSFPWLCLVFRVVGCSIGRLTARALSRSPAISRPVLRKVLAREKWPDWCERPRSRFLHGFQDVGQTRNLTIESASLERAWEIALIVD